MRCTAKAFSFVQRHTAIDNARDRRIPVRTKARLRAAASEHMAMLEQNSERVIGYFQDSRVRYAA